MYPCFAASYRRWFKRQTMAIIFLRSTLRRKRSLKLPFSSMRKHSWTVDRRCNSWRYTLHCPNASLGVSAVSSNVAMTWYCMTKTRSDCFKASLPKASFPLSRASLTHSFAWASLLMSSVDEGICSKFLIGLVKENVFASLLISPDSRVPSL